MEFQEVLKTSLKSIGSYALRAHSVTVYDKCGFELDPDLTGAALSETLTHSAGWFE
jgi:hypothetical protein